MIWHGFGYIRTGIQHEISDRQSSGNGTGGDTQCIKGMQLGHVEGSPNTRHYRKGNRIQNQKIQHKKGGSKRQ